MKKSFTILAGILILACSTSMAQNNVTSKGVFKTYEPGYFQNSILKGIEEFEKKDLPPEKEKVFKAEPSGMDIPTDKQAFKSYWRNEPVSQGNSSTCWSYSTTSFLESEVYRLSGQEIKLSEIYTVYWEYVERAKTWVEKRGDMNFGEGSEGNAVTKIMKKYGAVPYSEYSGLLPGQTFQAHTKMFGEMKTYLDFVKTNNLWNEDEVVATIKEIMKHYIGEPPSKFNVAGNEYTPLTYFDKVLRLRLVDYADVLSYMQQPYWHQVEYEVEDNWWHNKDYYNIPLDDFINVVKKSIKAGYTFSIGGDVSEAGFLAREANAAIIPTFDIPSSAIDENARQFRFSNKTTTDDHGLHVVGYLEKNGMTWFLVKDSGSGSRTGGKELNKNFGYYFFHEDYIKLKMMDIMVHKDMIKDLLVKFK
ncbi:MAG: C1 family peptidase [Bacteroidota bacterium]